MNMKIIAQKYEKKQNGKEQAGQTYLFLYKN